MSVYYEVKNKSHVRNCMELTNYFIGYSKSQVLFLISLPEMKEKGKIF